MARDPDGRARARIDRLDRDGVGVGRPLERGPEPDSRNRPVHVPGTLPGETVTYRSVHSGVRKLVGRLDTSAPIQDRSPDRIEPACPHFLLCGGCQLLHQNLDGQHRFKRSMVAGALGLPVDAVDPVVASPEPFEYRHWAKLVVGFGGVLGSYRPRTHDVTSMAGCLIHAPSIETFAQSLRASWAPAGRAPAGLRYVLARASRHAGRVAVTFVARSPPWAEKMDPDGWSGLRTLLARRPEVAAARLQRRDAEDDVVFGQGPSEDLISPRPLQERFGPLSVDLTRGGFNQINPGAAEGLYRHAAHVLQVEGHRAADLYAGSGGLTAHLFEAGATEVVAVESESAGVAALCTTFAERIAQGRLHVHERPVEAATDLWQQAERIVVNPPRKGLHPHVVEALRTSAAQRLVYVSCDPKTLSRDLSLLKPAYSIDLVTPFDLFPHTRHIETAVLLTRPRS